MSGFMTTLGFFTSLFLFTEYSSRYNSHPNSYNYNSYAVLRNSVWPAIKTMDG